MELRSSACEKHSSNSSKSLIARPILSSCGTRITPAIGADWAINCIASGIMVLMSWVKIVLFSWAAHPSNTGSGSRASPTCFASTKSSCGKRNFTPRRIWLLKFSSMRRRIICCVFCEVLSFDQLFSTLSKRFAKGCILRLAFNLFTYSFTFSFLLP